jgi:hypothetical protein
MATTKVVEKFRRGLLVEAIQHLDPNGADVPVNTLGVVFQPAHWHEPRTGPMVRFVNGGMCNVYDGEVKPYVTVRSG